VTAGCRSPALEGPPVLDCDEPSEVAWGPPPRRRASLPAGLVPADLDDDERAGPWVPTLYEEPLFPAATDGRRVDVAFSDPADPSAAILVRGEWSDEGFVLSDTVRLRSLGRVLGVARDDEGQAYLATAVRDDPAAQDASGWPTSARADIVDLQRIDPRGRVVWRVDLDLARREFDPLSRPIVLPNASGAPKVIAGRGQVLVQLDGVEDPSSGALIPTVPITSAVDGATGEVVWTELGAERDVVDRRTILDGDRFVSIELSLAGPRAIGVQHPLARRPTAPVFWLIGESGEPDTWARLGGVAAVDLELYDPWGYLVAFVAEDRPWPGAPRPGIRQVASMRVDKSFFRFGGSNMAATDAGVHLSWAESEGVLHQNFPTWFTGFDVESGLHAERPRIAPIGCDRFLVLWEQWRSEQREFNGLFGAVLNGAGGRLGVGGRVGDHRLPIDDLITVGGSAVWFTGDHLHGGLYVASVSADLKLSRARVD
jgi:hypothetical protein